MSFSMSRSQMSWRTRQLPFLSFLMLHFSPVIIEAFFLSDGGLVLDCFLPPVCDHSLMFAVWLCRNKRSRGRWRPRYVAFKGNWTLRGHRIAERLVVGSVLWPHWRASQSSRIASWPSPCRALLCRQPFIIPRCWAILRSYTVLDLHFRSRRGVSCASHTCN